MIIYLIILFVLGLYPKINASTIQRNLVIAAEGWSPYIGVTENHDGTYSLEGPMRKVLDVLTQKVNFTYSIVRPPDGYWGAIDVNGSFNGMLGQIERKEVNMALGPFFPTPSRRTVTAFSFPLWIDDITIIVGRPKHTFDFFNFVKPFGFWVQISILIFLIVVTIFIKIISSTEAEIFQNKKVHMTLLDTIMLSVKMFAQEASHTEITTKGMEIIFATWLLGTFILMKSYEGILTAMLSLPKVEIPIDSLEQLANQDAISWKLEGGSMMYDFFKQSKNPVARKIYANTNGTVPSCWSARKELVAGEFVSICDSTSIMKIMHWDFSTHGLCNMYKVREIVYEGTHLAISLPINSTFLPDVNFWILRLHQAGLLEKWIRDELMNATQCLGHPSSDGRSSETLVLQMNAFYGSFFLLASGYIISFITFLLELTQKLKDPQTTFPSSKHRMKRTKEKTFGNGTLIAGSQGYDFNVK